MNAHQRRKTDRALLRMLREKKAVSWPSWRPGAPMERGRVVEVYCGGKAAGLMPFYPRHDHDPAERVCLHRLRRLPAMDGRAIVQQQPDDEDGEWDDSDDYDCTHCGGEGFRRVEDPLWDDCDEFGWGPCTSCSGTGLRSRQTVF